MVFSQMRFQFGINNDLTTDEVEELSQRWTCKCEASTNKFNQSTDEEVSPFILMLLISCRKLV